MALTFKQLVALLTPTSGALSVTAAALETPSAAPLFGVAFKGGALSLTGAKATADEKMQQVAVTGSLAAGTCLGLTRATVTAGTFTLKGDGSVAVRLSIAVRDDGWVPSDSLPLLADLVLDLLTWEGPTFLVDTEAPVVLPAGFRRSFGYADDLPEVAEGVVKGLSLTATVGFTASLSPTLATFFESTMVLEGPVEILPRASTVAPGIVAPGTVDLFPQLLLTPSGGPGKTLTLGEYVFSFSFQAACLLQEFAGGAALGLIPTPVLAVRSTFAPSRDIPSIPVTAYLYDGGATQIGLDIGSPLSTRITESQLPQLLNGTALGNLLSPAVPGFPTIGGMVLQDIALTVGVNPASLQRIQLTAATGPGVSWTIIDGVLTVNSLAFEVGVVGGATGYQPNAAIACAAVLGTNTVTLEGWVSLPDLNFGCQLVETATLDLKGIVHDLVGAAINLPTITSGAVQLTGTIGQTATGWALAASIKEDWVICGTPDNGLTLGDIDLALAKAADGTVTGSVFGQVTLAGVAIQLSADYKGSAAGWTFTGGSAPGQSLNLMELFADLTRLFGIGLPDGLPETVGLDTLSMSYDTGTGAFSVDAAISLPDASVDLTALPLVGSHLDAANRLSLGGIAFHAGKDDKGTTVELTLTIALGTESAKLVTIPIVSPKSRTAGAVPAAAPVATPVATPVAANRNGGAGGLPVVYPTEGSGVWIPVQKTFGPVSFEKIGLVLDSAGLSVQINAALAVSALTVEVLGLGLAVPFTAPYTPSFSIAGLNVSYITPSLSIEGGLMRSATSTDLEFSGDLVVKTGNLSLVALGSYRASDPPSMFAFIMADVPIGGPPYFFVTGLAGGFGFNRDLILPAIDEVVSYPLVAGAVAGPGNPFGDNPTLGSALEVMDTYLRPRTGEDWLAAGIRFTSFDLMTSFALLTVAFGTRVQVGLIGVSSLALPPRTNDPVVSAQMAMVAVIDPEAGVLSVAAQLTPESYVLSRSCHLTGGFAFYLWFGANPQAGDFVVTLGGYSPFFTVPDHYPAVPRLGIKWKLDDAPLTITGGEYMALTPSTIMAGGSLKSVWKCGPIEAWFTANADFLMQWKPFHYHIDIGVNFGVKARVELLLVTITISVSIGASLALYGPPFAGKAHIDLGIISFTIKFGDKPVVPKVDWTDFKTSFLLAPPAGAGRRAPVRSGVASAIQGAAPSESPSTPTAGDGVVLVTVASGLLKQLDPVERPYLDAVVDPQRFGLQALLKVPAVTAACNGTALSGRWTTGLDIGPMGVRRFSSALSVTVRHEGVAYHRLRPEAVIAAAPKALWAVLGDQKAVLSQSPLVGDCFVGFTLTPFVDEPDHSLPIAVPALLYDAQATEAVSWGEDNAPTSDPWGGDDAIDMLVATVDDPAIDGTRLGIVLDLVANGFGLQTGIDTGALTDASWLKLLAPPVLHRLGENKAAPKQRGT